MSSPIPAKSPRTNEISAADAPSVNRLSHIKDCTFSTEFWHTNGDILIRVQTTWYLLHRGLLAAHSKLFRPEAIDRMATGQEFIGRQVFVPPCDEHRDWERVLMSVYNPASLNLWGKSLSSDELFWLIRAAKTLKFYKLVTLCLGRLETELPTTLNAFDEIYTAPMTGSMFKPVGCISSKEELFKAINLVLEFDHNRALPCAYLLALMEVSVEVVLEGIVSSDGSRVLLHAKAQQTLLAAYARIYPVLLHRFSDTISCLSARRQHCISRPVSLACLAAANALEERFRTYIPTAMAAADGATSVRRLLIASHRKGEWFEDASKGRCGTCWEAEKARIHLQRQGFWKQAPALFGLESPWETVGRM